MSMKFLKKGKAAHTEMAKAEAEAEARKKAAGIRRYWIPENAEGKVTFLDGDLGDEGLIEAVSFWEHQLKLNGNWRNWYPCTQVTEPCPICEGGDNPSLVMVFTVIDHGEWKDKQGVVHKDERRLFVCKRETFKRLQKIASKRGGLKGCTFDVSRVGEKSAGVGDTFDFIEKRTMPALAKALNLKPEDVAPFDYEEVLTYYTADQLRELGFGEASPPIGSEDKVGKPAGSKAKPKPKADDEDEEDDYADQV